MPDLSWLLRGTIQSIVSWGTILLITSLTAYLKRKNGWFKNGLFALIVTFAAVILVHNIYEFITEHKVYKPFQSVYEKYKNELGIPEEEVTEEDKKGGFIYQGAHEHAMAIYFMSAMNFYFLADNSTWIRQPDIWDPDYRLKNDKWLRQRFHPPKNLFPPYGGIARMWNLDPNKWSWLGFRIWHCKYNNGIYQKFKHGWIIGNFLRISNDKIHKPLLYVLICNDSYCNSGYWKSEPSTMEAPDCIQPIELKQPAEVK